MTSEPASNTLQIQTWLYFRMEKNLITLLTIEGRNIRLRKFLAVSGHSCWKSQLWEFWVGRIPSPSAQCGRQFSAVLRNITFLTRWKKFNLSVEFLLRLCFHVIGATCRPGPEVLITCCNLSTHHRSHCTSLPSLFNTAPLQEHHKGIIIFDWNHMNGCEGHSCSNLSDNML